MKRDPSSGSTSLAAPSTYVGSLLLYVTNYTLTHNLGSIPVFRAYYEPFGDGVVWPPMGTRSAGETINPRNTLVTGPGLFVYPTTTTIQFQLYYSANTLTGTFPLYYIVYKDYQV
jgi:hypothetical protein